MLAADTRRPQIASFSSLAGRKATLLLAAISKISPVAGLHTAELHAFALPASQGRRYGYDCPASTQRIPGNTAWHTDPGCGATGQATACRQTPGEGPVVNVHERIVGHGVAGAVRGQLARQPAVAVAVELQADNMRCAPSRRLWHALLYVDGYLRGQSSWLTNYAKRYRADLRVGTANFLVNRRMNKSQQMRWFRRGADLLLQVRCAVYNGTLGSGVGDRFQPHANQDARSAAAA
jgi:hypothetical protein